MGRRAGHADIADKIRGAAKRALLQLEEDGKPLSTILLEEFRERPLETIRAISAWKAPEAIEVEHNVTFASAFAQALKTLNDASGESAERARDGDSAMAPQSGELRH